LSSLTQIIVSITSLDAFSVVTDILSLLEASSSKKNSSEHEVQAGDSSERVADKPFLSSLLL
jgi:hypothetical protein